MIQPQKRHRTEVLTYGHGSSYGRLHMFMIPKDLSVSILLFVGIHDLCVLRVVSKEFQYLSNSAMKLIRSAKLSFSDMCPDFEEPLNLLATSCTRLTRLTLKNQSCSPQRACKALRPVLIRNPKVKICAQFVDKELYELLCDLKIELEEMRKRFSCFECQDFSSCLKRCLIDSRLCSKQWYFLKNCRNLEALGAEEVSDDILQELGNCPRLVSLRVLDFAYHNFSAQPQIREFSAKNISFQYFGVTNIAESFPNLQVLQICSPLSTTDLTELPQLKHLRVVGVTIAEGLRTALEVLAHVKMLKLCFAEYNLLAAFRSLKMDKIDASWEWLHFVASDLDGIANCDHILKVGAMASRLGVLKVNGIYVKGSEMEEPKWNIVAPWNESHFARKCEDDKPFCRS